jgi:hypothetical protein
VLTERTRQLDLRHAELTERERNLKGSNASRSPVATVSSDAFNKTVDELNQIKLKNKELQELLEKERE